MDKIVFDSKSHQAIRHLGTEAHFYQRSQNAGTWRDRRLIGLKKALTIHEFDMSFIDLESDTLDDVDVLVISGRSNIISFTDPELKTIESFYNRGGGLFLMANHKGFVEPQNQIAQNLRLPVTFHEKTVREDRQQLVLNSSHPISQNCQQGLNIRTSCTLTVKNSPETIVLVSNENSNIGVFAAAIERPVRPSKRAVVITSAGHISSLDDKRRDLFMEASNKTWTINAIKWLAGRVD